MLSTVYPLRISWFASSSSRHHGQVREEARQGGEGQDAAQDVAQGRQEAQKEEGRDQGLNSIEFQLDVQQGFQQSTLHSGTQFN